MQRPEIRPYIFLVLQNLFAAVLFSALLGAELVRRLLYEHPQSETLWRLSALANRTVTPALLMFDDLLPTPDKLLMGLIAGVVVPLVAWGTRYWFATALAGHVALAALIVMTYWAFRRGNLALLSADIPGAVVAMRPEGSAIIFLALSILLLVMCVADHVAFLRFLLSFRRRSAKPS